MKKYNMLHVVVLCLLATSFAKGKKSPVTVHGYAEVHAKVEMEKDGERMLDPHRTVIGLNANFRDKYIFDMEVDFEHSFTEPELEFAQFDFVLSENFLIRAGSMLLPVGNLNEFHEPPLFYSVERAQFHKYIVPTSWSEVGLGFAVNLADDMFRLRVFLINGASALDISTDANNATTYKIKSVRKSRVKGIEPSVQDVAGVGRLEISPVLGLDFGLSGYFGGIDQSRDEDKQATMGIFIADAKFRKFGVEVQGQFGFEKRQGTYFEDHLGKDDQKAIGALGELAYHFQDIAGEESDLVPFVRYERIDEDYNDDADSKSGYHLVTPGVAFFPIPNLAVKFDFNIKKHDNEEKDGNVFNLGIGIMY